MASPIKIFCCYAHEDQALLKRLKTHLISLQRQGLITTWADTDISPGMNWEIEISKHINSAQIILLLISPDFMASNYCYSKEMTQALDRHNQGNACVIPIILRPVYFQGAPFEKLKALPRNAKPLKKWSNIDEGFLSIIEGIQVAIKNLPQPAPSNIPLQTPIHQPVRQPILPNAQPTPSNIPLQTPIHQPILPNAQPAPSNIPLQSRTGQSILPSAQNTALNTSSHTISKQPAGQLILPNAQTPPLPLNTIPQPTTNQPPTQLPPRTYRIPLLNTSSLLAANQPATPSISAGSQSTPLNAPFYPTNNQPLIQPLPVPLHAPHKTIKTSSKHPLIFKIFKITLYFIGAFIAEFGFLGGALTAVEKDPNLSARVGGIAFSIGIIALLVSTTIFFRKHYYRYHMHFSQYMKLLGIASVAMIILLVLCFSFLQSKSTDPVSSAIVASVFFLYGISLMIITYLKPSP